MATIEIGVEVKILAKAMIKQIDRVTGDLTKQVGQYGSVLTRISRNYEKRF